jgi:hypothetical protein
VLGEDQGRGREVMSRAWVAMSLALLITLTVCTQLAMAQSAPNAIQPHPQNKQEPTERAEPPRPPTVGPSTDSAGPRSVTERPRSNDDGDSRTIMWAGVAGLFGIVIGFVAGRSRSSWALRDESVKRSQPPTGIADTLGAREAFGRQCREFRDIYASIWRAAESDEEADDARRKILARWDDRIKRVGQPALVTAWTGVEQRSLAAPRDAARAWLAALQSWGLKCDFPRTIEVSEATLDRFYVFPQSQSAVAEVKEPCWTFENVVLQKGHAISVSD